MPPTTRAFVAIAVPDDHAAALARLQAQLGPEVPGARWVGPSQFHLTLAFLGDVADAALDGIYRAVAEASVGFGPLELRIEGLGAFPDPARPRTLWAGLSGPDLGRLADLQRAVVAAVVRAGYPPDDRFHPHVTLGRLKPGRGPIRDISSLIQQYRAWSAGSFIATEVVTFASKLQPGGPTYTPLALGPLTGQKPGLMA